MSYANLYVKFPDGSVSIGLYYGTSDSCDSNLEPMDLASERYGDPVAVEVATDYGDGSHWRGRATSTCLYDGHLPGRDHCPVTSGLPEWVPNQ